MKKLLFTTLSIFTLVGLISCEPKDLEPRGSGEIEIIEEFKGPQKIESLNDFQPQVKKEITPKGNIRETTFDL